MVHLLQKHVYDSHHGTLPEYQKNLQYLTRRIGQHSGIVSALFVACVYFLLSLIHPTVALSAENSTYFISSRNLLIKFEEGLSPEERMHVYETTLGYELCSQVEEGICYIIEEFKWFEELNLARIKVSQRSDLGGVATLHVDVISLSEHAEVTNAEIDDNVVRLNRFENRVDDGIEIGEVPDQEGIVTDDPDLYDLNKTYAPAQISMTEGWHHTFGNQEIVIGILDTGINANHVEFSGRIKQGIDIVNRDDDPDDDHGHGTHAAGIIAAAADNSVGSAGVCPNCSIMPIKVLTDKNVGTWGDVIEGIMYAADNGVHIINLSLGSIVPSDSVHDAIKYAHSRGVLIVAAAGNFSRSDPFYPAYFKETLAVSATDQTSELWSLSNFGSYVDVSAPGDRIYSTDNTLDDNGAGFTYRSGTSMAAAHVSGLAGLLLSQNATYSVVDLKRLITQYADDLGPDARDDKFGAGRINVCKSMDAVSGPPLHDPPGNPQQIHNVYLPVIQN